MTTTINLTKYLGGYPQTKVEDLPIDLLMEILNGFTFKDELFLDMFLTAYLQTWDEFIESCSIIDGTEDNEYWEQLLQEASHKEEIKDGYFIVKINLINLPFCSIEKHNKYDNVASIFFGLHYLIVNADNPNFGIGYVVIGKNNDLDYYLACDLCSYEEALHYVNKL